MTVEFTLRCDMCGQVICTSTHSERGLRGEAQLRHGAYCSTATGDICDACRKGAPATPAGDALKGAPSVGTQR